MIQARQSAVLTKVCVGLSFCWFFSGLLNAQTADVAHEFQAMKIGSHEYSDVRTISLGRQMFVLALWHPDSSPLELSGDIYQYISGQGQPTFAKEFTGNLSEEILEIATLGFVGAHPQLAILCRSGQIKILRILEKKKEPSS